ncbi:kinetochore associated 1 [Schistosoma japonicum]|nr:kinetochore associated 1 [Schistosoma japonicum]
MYDLFEAIEQFEITIHEDLVPFSVPFIERYDKKVVAIRRTLFLFDCDFKVTDSYEHDCNIVKVCSPPSVLFLFFLDEQGLFNVYLPEKRSLAFSLTHFGRIFDLQLVTTSAVSFDLLLRSGDSLLLWRDINSLQLHSELIEQNFEELNARFKSTERVAITGKMFICCHLNPAVVWNLQLGSPSFITICLKESSQFVVQSLFDPFLVIEESISLRKLSLICDTIYCLALSYSGHLFLFNMFASICLGCLNQFPRVHDFYICSTTSQSTFTEDNEFPGLHEITIVILRDLEENDQPSPSGPSKLLELILFPSYQVIYRTNVSKDSWLLSDYDVGSYKAVSTGSQVLYAELLSKRPDESLENFLSIKALRATNPKERLQHLLISKNFEEARLLVKTFNLDCKDFQLVVTTELEFLVNTIHKHDQGDDLYPRLLTCLQQTEELWKHLDIVESILRITMPKSDDQLKLLLIIKEKLIIGNSEDMSTEHEDIGIKVLILLKRLKAFLMIHGPDNYTIKTWVEFRDENIYVIFARLFLSKSEGTSDLSQAFLFWILYKGELSEFLTWDTLELLCNLLSKRPLTCFTSNHLQSGHQCDSTNSPYQSQELELLESEEAIQKWIRNELLPVVIRQSPDALPLLVKYLTQRVKELEACSFTSNSNICVQENKLKCPFSWPSTAISWINKFLDSVNISESINQECVYNIGSVADLYLSGIASRDPNVDPFYELRKLAKQLETIKLLRDVYNCHLSIDFCEGETELSIAYRILDVAFNLGTCFDNGIDKLTARYLKDRNIDHQTFFQGYSYDLINRIRMAIQSSVLDEDCPPEWLGSPPKCKQSNKEIILDQEPHILSQHACLVAGWITVPSCRMKVVFDLASVAPLPWSNDLITLTESVLKQARIPSSCSQYVDGLFHMMNKLERLCNIARLHEIFTRYGLKEFSLSDIGYGNTLWLADQAISRILRSNEGPFNTNISFSTPRLDRSDTVYRDATTVAQKLLDQSQWPLLFAQLYMELALFKALELNDAESINFSDDYDNRISFFITHLNFSTNEALHELFSHPNSKLLESSMQLTSIRDWLIRLTFRSIKHLLKHGNLLFPSQRSLIVDLGLSLASMRITLNSTEYKQNGAQMNWCHLMKFIKLYTTSPFDDSNLHDSEVSIILELFSNDKCVFGLLTDRLHIIRCLTKSYVEQVCSSIYEPTDIDKMFNFPMKLRSSYRLLLPDLPYGILEELMTWQWFSLLCSSICTSSVAITSESCSQSNLSVDHSSSLISQGLRVHSLLVKMMETLTNIHQTRLHSKANCERIEVSSISSYLVPTCYYCSCIWNRPLGRLGCVFELFMSFVFPFLLKVIKSIQLDEMSIRKSIVNIVQAVLSTFSSLLLWAGGQDQLNPLVEQKCICRIFALTNEFQALRLVVQAFTSVFSQIDRAYQSTSGEKDPLECLFCNSLYHEQTTTDVFHSKSQSNHLYNSLKWLANLLQWFTCHYSYTGDNNKIYDDTKNEENKVVRSNNTNIPRQILEDGMKLASSWYLEFGLCLTGAHTLLIGIMNLIRSSVARNIWSDSFIFDLGLQELNNDVVGSCFDLCNQCLSSSLNSILNPSSGKYLDQPLALSIALALPIEEATTVVRNVVAQNKHTPKKIMAVANIIFMFSQITCKADLSLLQLSQTMANTWSWHIVLKPYKLNFSRLITHGIDHSSLEHILDKLCRMIPSINEESVYIVPSEPRSESVSRILNTTNERSLPPIKLIAEFAKDFNIPLKPYLFKHLNYLFRPCNGFVDPTVSVDGNFPFTGFDNNSNNTFLPTSTTEINGSNVNRFMCYQKVCLSRAHTILKLLFRSAKQSDNSQHSFNELANLLQSFYASTSPYDYERLSFLFSWIRTCCPKMIANKQIQLLNFLRAYRRSHPPRDFELERVSAGSESELGYLPLQAIMFSKSEGYHQLGNMRMPYHQLLDDSLPIKIIGPEITSSNVNFWLRVNQSMEWNSSDLIKITAAQNLVNQYTIVGLLPVTNSNYVTEELTVPRSVGWDRALPCQILIEPLFSKLHNLLETVESTFNVYSLLSGLSRRVIYGPHRLLVLRLARNLAKTYLLRADNEARLVYARNKQSCSTSKTCPNEELLDSDSDESEKEPNENIRLARIALEKAETSHKQFAIEGCLYEHHLADWEEVNKHFNSPFELILNILYKAASELQPSVTWNSRSGLPISELFLRRRVIKALPHIAELAQIDLLDVAKHILVNRLKLPSRIFMNDGELNGSPITNRSMLLDMTVECSEFSPNDISFNTTVYQPQLSGVTSFENQRSDQSEPKQEDFMLAELLLQSTRLKNELLPILDIFVFADTPNQYVSAKWRAARCILRSQSGLTLRPKLSFSELRSTLLRLSTLASCPTATSQQLIFGASFSCTSSRGDTFNSLCCTRLTNSMKQLLASSSNTLTTIHFASCLVLDYELSSPPTITQLLEFINRLNAKESLDYALLLLVFMESSPDVKGSMKWFLLNPVKQSCTLHYLLSSLIERILLRLLNREHSDSRKLHDFLNKLLCFLIAWPIPDKEIEAIFSQLSKSIIPVISQQTIRLNVSLQRIMIIISVFLRLLALSTLDKYTAVDLDLWFNLINENEGQNVTKFIRDAILNSEICLTSKFLSCL